MRRATAGGINFSDLVGRLAIHSAQAPALRLITHDDKDPILSVAARGSPDGGVENLSDQFLRNRVRLQPAQCAGGVHRIEESDLLHLRNVLAATTLGRTFRALRDLSEIQSEISPRKAEGEDPENQPRSPGRNRCKTPRYDTVDPAHRIGTRYLRVSRLYLN